ncbi:MAG: TMEM175 family protein [Dokdonella sp.]
MSARSTSERDEDGFQNRGAEVTRAEAFFDAAFAFAITLMVISIDEIPDSAEKLLNALKAVPAFAASFLLIVLFWRAHADWSRHYGLNDRHSQRLSLLMVFLVLVFIYPLRMFFGAFFEWISQGMLPTQLSISDTERASHRSRVCIWFRQWETATMSLYRHAPGRNANASVSMPAKP